MKHIHEEILEIINHYRILGAPGDQQMLISALKEAQEADRGVLTQAVMTMFCEEYALKETFLKALIRRIPSLRPEETPHRLEICGNCARSRELTAFIEEQYAVKSGGSSAAGRFTFQITGCMKNCRNGPSARWDGVLYPRSTPELLESLIQAK